MLAGSTMRVDHGAQVFGSPKISLCGYFPQKQLWTCRHAEMNRRVSGAGPIDWFACAANQSKEWSLA